MLGFQDSSSQMQEWLPIFREPFEMSDYIILTLVSGDRSLNVSPTFIFSGLPLKLESRKTARSGFRLAISLITLSGTFLSKQGNLIFEFKNGEKIRISI